MKPFVKCSVFSCGASPGQTTDANAINNDYLTKGQLLHKPDEVINGFILGKAHVKSFGLLSDIHSKAALEEKIPLYQRFDDKGNIEHPGVFHQPEYDNWNMIMRVVEKISKGNLYSVNIDTWAGVEIFPCARGFAEPPILTVDLEVEDGNKLTILEAVVLIVVKFIEYKKAKLSEPKVE